MIKGFMVTKMSQSNNLTNRGRDNALQNKDKVTTTQMVSHTGLKFHITSDDRINKLCRVSDFCNKTCSSYCNSDVNDTWKDPKCVFRVIFLADSAQFCLS